MDGFLLRRRGRLLVLVNLRVHSLLQKAKIFRHNLLVKAVKVDSLAKGLLELRRLLFNLFVFCFNFLLYPVHIDSLALDTNEFIDGLCFCDGVKDFEDFDIFGLDLSKLPLKLGILVLEVDELLGAFNFGKALDEFVRESIYPIDELLANVQQGTPHGALPVPDQRRISYVFPN